MAPVGHIQLTLKPAHRDLRGEALERAAHRHLGIATGRIRIGKIYSLLGLRDGQALRELAELGLRDEILHDLRVNGDFQEPWAHAYLLVSRLPGVTDDEGAAVERTVQDLAAGSPAIEAALRTAGGEAPGTLQAFSHDVFYFESELCPADLERIGSELCANPLVSHLDSGARLDRPCYLPTVAIAVDARTELVDLERGDEELIALSRARTLALSLDEMKTIRDHFRDPAVQEGRRQAGIDPARPTDCELEILAQTWSEHCKHKELNALVRFRDHETGDERQIDSLFDTFIRRATEWVGARLEELGASWLVKVFSDNAGVVRLDPERLFVFKVETHNSPSALDPYGGALTGILGVNRDPLGTGRGGARLLFNTNVLCFGPPDYAAPLLPGQLHPARVLAGVRKGIEDGGNKSGIPTVAGALLFDERFAGKPLVFCGTGAILPARYQGRAAEDKEVSAGDAIVMVGGRVGKDGIHGATFSSTELAPHSPRSAVQIGSPFTQKLLSDFLEIACCRGLVRAATDNGAGGLSSSVGELAPASGGATVELSRVPLKYAGLRPWEIFVSESQERMTLAVDPASLPALRELARAMDVELSAIGHFDQSGTLAVRSGGALVALLDLGFLHDGVPRKELRAEWQRPALAEPAWPSSLDDHGAMLGRLLGSLDICSRERLIRQYDHEVKGRTIVKPLMGPTGKAPQDAAVLRLHFDSYAGLAIAHGIAPRYGDIDPYEMSAGAFDEAIRQLVGVGGRLPEARRGPTSVWSANDNFCMPDVELDEQRNSDGALKLGKLVRMCQALYDCSTFFLVPMTSGKDSMKNDLRSGESRISIPPTVLYSVVASIADVRQVTTTELKAEGDLLYQLGPTYDELGGSALYRLRGELGAKVPRLRMREAKERYLRMAEAHERGLFESCHDLSDGGLGVALCECAFGGPLGFEVTLPDVGLAPHVQLYAESHSRFIVSVRPERRGELEELFGEDAQRLGRVSGEGARILAPSGEPLVDRSIAELLQIWCDGLEGYL
jgi:phosphoribosylformylglycinamidine synthase